MAVFEVESWFVAEGKEHEHDAAMRDWLQWIGQHRALFKEWKSVRYFIKREYDSLADFEAYKKRRANYEGPYAEYKKHDPYYKNVFVHIGMKVEVWNDKDRDLWLL